MEIYTGDLIGMAQECATKISEQIGYTGYVVEDECCNLQRDIRKVLYDRLTVAFNDLLDQEIEHPHLRVDLQNKIFKIINEL